MKDFDYIIKTFKDLGFEATVGQGGAKGSIVLSHKAEVFGEIPVRARPVFMSQRANSSWLLQVTGTDMSEEFSLQEAIDKAYWWLTCSELEYEMQWQFISSRTYK